jgi:putative oxidoreductase
MCAQCKPWGLLIGRILLGPILLLSGVMKLMNGSKTAEEMALKGMVAVPFFMAAAAVVEIVGGLSVILGVKGRLATPVLALFLIPVTAIFFDFWAYEGPAMQNQMQHFLKNVTIIGGLLLLAVPGAGRPSIDMVWWRSAPALVEIPDSDLASIGRQASQLRHFVLLRG